ncbi:uncharacterized protein [Littorina saxatilis]|uniref:uncharacterized protein n=1 Tax=Littorina saxatilis TaxID=31220 RepID=UPI0038B5D1BC
MGFLSTMKQKMQRGCFFRSTRRSSAWKGVLYPDPFAITTGCKGEQDGRFLWPSVFITDISEYLKQTAACELDLVHRLINEYKEGKAYRYYTCERVRKIKYHPVRTTSANCYLSASVYPSMSTRKPYKVWVMVSKKGETTVGGEIQAAYCTCPSGLLGSCNHVAGLLFRVEAAVTVSDDMGDPLATSFITEKHLNTPAVRHGRALDPAAKEAAKIELLKSHTNCIFKDCGLFLSVNHPFLGASPDLLVSCSCCGHFVVEIKCPISVADCVPTADNIPYVHLNQGNMRLKERHVYFGQIQGQIALTSAEFAMLFVYSVHGHIFVKVNKDTNFWTDMCEKLTWFWTRFVGPKLLKATNPVCSADLPSSSSSSPPLPTIMPSFPAGPSLPQLPVVRYTPRRVLKRKRTTPKIAPMYLCGCCGDDIPENPQDFKEFSIQCDHCPQWYHFSCVGIKEGEVPDDADIWKCPKCVGSL